MTSTFVPKDYFPSRPHPLPLNDSGEVNVELPFWNENMTIKDLLKMLRAGS